MKNGRIRSRQRGRIIKFVCNAGFQLAGEKNAYCINGTWDMPIPKCVRAACPVPKDVAPLNGLMMPSHGNAVLNFYCKQGYELHGPSAVFCEGSTWDNSKPSCIPSNTKPSFFCDFENPDICHWTHDLNHDMDWKRDSYKTPTGYSMETGPSHDHTKGEGANGHYMYIESSSRRMNDTARLISPIFGKANANTCLEFWYHMYGRTTGSLRAYMKKVTDPWPLTSDHILFSKTGNQGNVWYRAVVNLGVTDQDYQIIMEGVRGNGYVSDTAIDDVRIIENCVYEDYLLSTTETPLPVSEILKTVDTCADRCGHKASGNDGPLIISCDCDDYCFERSRCCPDVFDVCFSTSSTTEFDTTTEIQFPDTTQKRSVPSNSTVKNATIDKKDVLPSVTTKTVTILSTKAKPTPRVAPTTAPTRKPQIPVVAPSRRLPSPPPTRRPLIILSAATTPAIYRKFVSIPPRPPNKTISKVTFVKPTENRSFNDVLEVPTKSTNDVELLISSPPPPEDSNDIPLQEKEAYVERIANEKELFDNNDVYPENLGKIKTEFRQSQSEGSNVKLIFVAIATVCGVATLIIISALVLVKYRIVRCRSRRMTSGNGDSQSDVRFLTADEVLDFNLDNDDL